MDLDLPSEALLEFYHFFFDIADKCRVVPGKRAPGTGSNILGKRMIIELTMIRVRLRFALPDLLAAICLFECRYIDLLHLKHRLHHTVRFYRITIIQQLDQNGGHDLP